MVWNYYHQLRRQSPSAEDPKLISIDTLTDAQIEKMDRDTFLRDFFLAGDTYMSGLLPLSIVTFTTKRQRETTKKERDAIINKSLPKKMHDFIAQWLEFNTVFESMTVEQKRELFTAEAKMMVDESQIAKMLESMTQENERGNHNWF